MDKITQLSLLKLSCVSVVDSNGGACVFEGGITKAPTSFSTGISCTTASIYESVSMAIRSVFGGGSTSTTYTTINPPGGVPAATGGGGVTSLSTGPALLGLTPLVIQAGNARRNIMHGRDSQITRSMPPLPPHRFLGQNNQYLY